MAFATSSQPLAFTKPHHFTHTRDADGWFCNVCTPLDSGHVDYMSAQAAMQHERNSPDHARNVSEADMWWNPPPPDAAAWDTPIEEDPPLTIEEMKMRESRLHVDHVRDMVPFWMKGVEAAQRGEVLRLEKFLESLQDDPWIGSVDQNPWGYAYPPGEWDSPGTWGGEDRWAGAGWGRADSMSSMHARRTATISNTGSNRPQAKATRERAKKWSGRAVNHPLPGTDGDAYTFVECIARQQAANAERKRNMHAFFEMPTQEKLKKIDEVICNLRATHGG